MSHRDLYSTRDDDSGCGFTLGQTIPYLRRRLAFTAADKFGAMVAHQDIARMGLTLDSVVGMDVLVQSRTDSTSGELDLALAELRGDYPDKAIEMHDATELLSLAGRRNYVFPIDGANFLKLCSARRSNPGLRFPASVVIHAVPGHHQIEPCILALLFAQPYDVLVVSSEQARLALEVTMEAAADIIGKISTTKTRSLQTVKIPLCVDTEFIHKGDGVSEREALGLTPHDLVLLYVGRLSASYKADLEPLLRVFQQLCEKTPSLKLILAGRDDERPYAPELVQLAVDLGIRDHVTVLPNFPFNLKPALLSAADIFVSPVDNIQESFGLSIIEAMAAGLPVIASDWSGYRDLIVHGETGLLVETYWDGQTATILSTTASMAQSGLAESLLSRVTIVSSRSLFQCLELVIDNQDLRKALGIAGRRRAERLFSMRVVADQYEALWKAQWRKMRRQPNIRSAGPSIDFNTVFGHFASHHIADEMLLSCSRQGRELLSNADTCAHKIPPEFDRRNMERAIAICADSPQPLKKLCGDSGASRQLLLWLLKKGHLETTECVQLQPDRR